MIVTVTMNPSLDKSTSVEKMVAEKKLRCEELLVEAGGGGLNVSKALKELGVESCAVFPAGGNNGQMVIDELNRHEVRSNHITIGHETRENISILETSTNQQYRFVMPGAPLSQKEADQCLQVIKKLNPRPTILVGSGSLPPEFPEDFYEQLGQVAKEFNAKYIVDTSGDPLRLALKSGVFLLKPNVAELARLVDKDTLEMQEVQSAAVQLIRDFGCQVIVVSLGASGALAVTAKGYEYVIAPTVKKMTTVGAGDSAVAGMIYMMAKGKGLAEMVRFGVACGTAATMNPGTHLFRKEDAWRLYEWISQSQKPSNFY